MEASAPLLEPDGVMRSSRALLGVASPNTSGKRWQELLHTSHSALKQGQVSSGEGVLVLIVGKENNGWLGVKATDIRKFRLRNGLLWLRPYFRKGL